MREEGEQLRSLGEELLSLIDLGEIKYCVVSEGNTVMLVNYDENVAQVGQHLTLNSIFGV